MVQTIIRTIFFYFVILVAYRLMGKREVGQLGVVDLIVSILIAELVALGIEKIHQNILMTLLPIIVLVIIEILMGLCLIKSRKFNKLFGGKPTILIDRGKIVFKNLINQRYAIDDLLLELRQKSIKNISDVEYAFLEPNGKLSIFKYNILKTKSDYPMPIIIEGKIELDTLKYINKNKTWVLNKLHKKNIKLEDVFYSFYKNNKLYIIKKN